MMAETPASVAATTHLETEVVSLHEQFADSLFRYASSIADDDDLAHDAVQETFLRYFIQRQYGREIANPRAWLYQVLRNYLRDRMGSASSKREVPGENLDRVAAEGHDPEALVERSQIAREIAACLSDRELECLQLRTEGLSYEEIGVAMEVRIGTVGAMLNRAHEKIRRRALVDGDPELGLARAIYHLVNEGRLCTQTSTSS
jgi:RNA polymerase sigma-70 factor (ECF subfamily)